MGGYMTRSRKKYPVATDQGKSRARAKKVAARKARRAIEIASGGAFKKTSQSWDICDWRWWIKEPNNEDTRK
jgi:hypothetical protein